MSKNKLFIIVSLFVLTCILFGFFASYGGDPTTAVSFSTFTPVEQTTVGDFLGTWMQGAPIPSPGSTCGAGVSYTNATGDTCWLYSINGDVSGSGNMPGQFRRYNMRTNTWQDLGLYPTGRSWVSAGKIGPVSNTDIYIVGGIGGPWYQMTGTLQRYNINTNTWTLETDAPLPTGSSGVSGYQDSLLYVIGGFQDNSLIIPNVQLYNKYSNSWRAATPLPSARVNGWMVIKENTIYYGCGAGPITPTFNNNIFVGVISQSNRANITWNLSSITYPGTNRHRMDADLFGCNGIFIGPGAMSTWWGTGNEAYTWNGGNSAFVNIGPIPVATSDAQVGAGYFKRGAYNVWKAVVATGLIMQAPYHILNTQVYTDSCEAATGWCEGFNTTTFPPSGWSLTGSANLWSRAAVSAYGLGTGSAKADFYNVQTGNQQLFSQTFTPFSNLQRLVFADAYCTYVNENDQLQILASTNGGSTWDQIILLNGLQLVTAPPQTAAFTPTSSQWKWQNIDLPAGTNKVQFNAITAYGNNLYIDSICVKDVTGGITPITLTPSEYSLSQNYPNPFNPTTHFEFRIADFGFVKLVIFDILGREIDVLVNEELNPGTYEVEWDGSNYSSGIYFYRLVVKDASTSLSTSFSASKKMLMVK